MFEGGGEREGDVHMGSTLLSVQDTSMLPWGQPEPPEMTFLMRKDGGAAFCGAAMEVAARTRKGSMNFMTATGRN